VLQPFRTAGAHEQADGDAGHHALVPWVHPAKERYSHLFEPMTDGISLADDTDHRDRLGDGRGRAVGSEAAITEIVMVLAEVLTAESEAAIRPIIEARASTKATDIAPTITELQAAGVAARQATEPRSGAWRGALR
jgi:hypothetical protein